MIVNVCCVTVELPPVKLDSGTGKVFTFDHDDNDDDDELKKVGQESRLNIEVICVPELCLT